MTEQIKQTLDFVEFLFDRGYLDITEEPDQEQLVEAFTLFCMDNGCYKVDDDSAEQKAFELYAKKYRFSDNSSDSDEEFERAAEEKALRICIRKLNTCNS